jgi:hypothetical protein
VFSHVKYNEPHGSYSSATGYFTVPTAGLYYFIASASPSGSSSAHFYLYVDYTQIDDSYSYSPNSDNEMASVHGVVHLQAGQRVWVRSDGGPYWTTVDAFTGFLLSPDF